MSYSVAIRTLGTSPETLRMELLSLHRQTVMPDAIFIYIAEGYARPDFRVGMERYIEVPKGMVSQRALDYNEINSEYILLLDDDVVLADDSAETLLRQAVENSADCVAADTFANHRMSVASKLKAIISNFVFPSYGREWAFRMHSNGSFSYINNPTNDVYPSQSAAGPASLWKKRSLLAIHLEDEIWLDRFGFAYGDDDLEFYKLYVNGGRLLVSFSSGIVNLDSKSSSASFQRDSRKFFVRSISNLIRWHRMQYLPRKRWSRIPASFSFGFKEAWLCLIHLAISVTQFDVRPAKYFMSGIIKGFVFISSEDYKNLRKYKNENIVLP